MKILFAVNSDESDKNDIVEVILNEYQRMYKKIISNKRVFYYDAIINEIKQSRENQYDLIVISEDLEKNTLSSYDEEDEVLYRRLDNITDEAYKDDGTVIPIILICNDRRSENDDIIKKLFVIGIYNILVGRNRTIQNVCSLIEKPRNKKQAKLIYNINPEVLNYAPSNGNTQEKVSDRELVSILKFFNANKENTEKCVKGFSKLAKEYSETKIEYIIEALPLEVRIILEENSKEYIKYSKVSVKKMQEDENRNKYISKDLKINKADVSNSSVIIPGRKGIFKKFNNKND